MCLTEIHWKALPAAIMLSVLALRRNMERSVQAILLLFGVTTNQSPFLGFTYCNAAFFIGKRRASVLHETARRTERTWSQRYLRNPHQLYPSVVHASRLESVRPRLNVACTLMHTGCQPFLLFFSMSAFGSSCI